jgi:hypothetical protein
MPRINRRVPLRRKGLTDAQELELLISSPESAFDTPEAREAAWFAHRDELMSLLGPMSRPQGFWDYEGYSKLPREKDFAALKRLGLLTEEEKRLARKWAGKGDERYALD